MPMFLPLPFFLDLLSVAHLSNPSAKFSAFLVTFSETSQRCFLLKPVSRGSSFIISLLCSFLTLSVALLRCPSIGFRNISWILSGPYFLACLNEWSILLTLHFKTNIFKSEGMKMNVVFMWFWKFIRFVIQSKDICSFFYLKVESEFSSEFSGEIEANKSFYDNLQSIKQTQKVINNLPAKSYVHDFTFIQPQGLIHWVWFYWRGFRPT